MTSDDLNRPLGQDRDPAPLPGPKISGRALLATGALVVAGGVGIMLYGGDPLGGEPQAVAAIERVPRGPEAATPAAPAKVAEAARADPYKARETAGEIEDGSGVKVIRGRGGAAPGAVVIHVPDPAPTGSVRSAALDRRLSEKGKHGPLPKMAEGLAPREAYARPFDASAAAGKPKIAVVLTGLGLGAGGTGEATRRLPGEVTFAFAPYGSGLEAQVARARGDGHEVLLQVPMEPAGAVASPGPQTLTTEAGDAQNLDRLHWLMARFQGYVGLTNYLGQRFLADPGASRPLAQEAARRGLLFVDDGAGGRSAFAGVAAEAGLPALRADIVLDGIDKAADLDAALARAESLARSSGRAVVMAPALPGHVERVQRWLRGLPAKGIVLAPVSALSGKGRS